MTHFSKNGGVPYLEFPLYCKFLWIFHEIFDLWKRDETACLFELINPVPSKDVNNMTGISHTCDPVSVGSWT